MSLPPIDPERTASGITVDPRTQQRVVPQTRRADGSLRKEIKIRQGFTPQEDVSRFRGSRQQQMDANTLPKGHILGWVAPTGVNKKSTTAADSTGKPLSKSQKKNEKRREKKREEKARVIQDSWEDEEEEDGSALDKDGKVTESRTKDEGGRDFDALVEKLEGSVKLE